MKRPSPPRKMIDFLEWFCHPSLVEGIIGDLMEHYELSHKQYGATRAGLLFYWQAFGFVKLRFMRKQNISIMNFAMLSNFFRTALRTAARNKQFFAINLIGLIFAITAVLYAFVFVQDELAYDKFHQDLDQIHRVYKRHLLPAENIDHLTAETSGMMGPTMKTLYPEITECVRIRPFDEVVVYRQDEAFQTDNWYFVDSSFFDLFSFELLEGTHHEALNLPKSVVLSESFAKKIFGDRSPLGEAITGFGDVEYIVTGVVQDPPIHSTFHYDLLASWSTTVPNVGPVAMNWMNNWLAQGVYTYVKLIPGADINSLESKLAAMMQEYFEERADQYFLFLQPFRESYLYSADIRYQEEFKVSSIRFVYILCLSALLISLIVLVNYINITLSKVSDSRREVGIRKVLGSSSYQMISRFMTETLVATTVATVIAFLLLLSLMPSLNAITGKEILASSLLSWPVLGVVGGCILSFSLALGWYPALVLSRPTISALFRGDSIRSFNSYLKKGLLGMQFAIAIVLLIFSIVIFRQTQYLKNKPLGFNSNQLIVVNTENEVGEKGQVFEAELLKNPDILSVSMGRSAIGSGSYTTTVVPEGKVAELGTRIYIVDPEFFDTYGIPITRGRSFHEQGIGDSAHVIVNRSLVEAASWDDPIGKRIRSPGSDNGLSIIGVVEDFHYQSLSTATIEPMAILVNPQDRRTASIRYKPTADFHSVLNHIEQSWAVVATKTPLSFYEVDLWYEQLYEKESQLMTTTSIYSMISLLLCALGLYGLIALLLQQKEKEISIRKVLGADTRGIIKLINKHFLSIIVISLLVGMPIGFYWVNNWLSSFAYSIELGFGSFLVAAIILFVLSLSVISLLAGQVSRQNPVEFLKES